MGLIERTMTGRHFEARAGPSFEARAGEISPGYAIRGAHDGLPHETLKARWIIIICYCQISDGATASPYSPRHAALADDDFADFILRLLLAKYDAPAPLLRQQWHLLRHAISSTLLMRY